MIKFLFKGVIRDKSRSVLPITIVAIGVALTVMLSGYLSGVFGDLTDQSARFQTGHVKVISQAYAAEIDQAPIELALLDIDALQSSLSAKYPEVKWVKRTNFGGLIDVPDQNNETKGQGPAAGMAIELFDKSSGELERMNIIQSIVTGKVPTKNGEALISDDFAQKLDVKVGDKITYVGSTMNGSMTFMGFVVSGTIRFGQSSLDRGAIVIDISDAQQVFDMQDGSSEILGFLDDGIYVESKALAIKNEFNSTTDLTDEYAPTMLILKEQNNLASYLDMADLYSQMFIAVFVFAMSIVLWNTGLLGGLRRYQEFGIRLALGESKGQIYRSLVTEAFVVGILGSVVGTAIGLAITWYMQHNGIDISGMIKNSSMMMPSLMKSKFEVKLMYIGFIPGVLAMVVGNMLSGIGIYRRETATLFKELEV